MGQLMMISFDWWCFQFMPSGGVGEHVVLGCFGGYGIVTLARDGSSKGNKYISAIKVKIQVRKKKIP